MAKVGAQRAAELTGKSKSTIQRAMKAGKISYELNDNNQRCIDVSELERVFGLVPQGNVATSATVSNTNAPVTPNTTVEMEIQKAKHTMELERQDLQIRLLNEQLDNAREQIADLKAQRDQWQKQAQQVLLTSQQSQKQAEEHITELRDREATRQRMIQQRNRQQRGDNVEAKTPSGQHSKQPQFRTVRAENQNRRGGFRLSDFFKGKKTQSA